MQNYIFKTTKSDDILKAESKFFYMFDDIVTSYQNNEPNFKSIGTVVNYGRMIIKQIRLSSLEKIYEKKVRRISLVLDALIKLK